MKNQDEVKNAFTGATSAEINSVITLLEQGTQFLHTLKLATIRVREALEETERFRAAVKRGDTVLDWREALQEMSSYNELAASAASNATLERFDMGKCTLLASNPSNHTELIMFSGLIKDFLTERYGVKFKVRIHRPEEPIEL